MIDPGRSEIDQVRAALAHARRRIDDAESRRDACGSDRVAERRIFQEVANIWQTHKYNLEDRLRELTGEPRPFTYASCQAGLTHLRRSELTTTGKLIWRCVHCDKIDDSV